MFVGDDVDYDYNVLIAPHGTVIPTKLKEELASHGLVLVCDRRRTPELPLVYLISLLGDEQLLGLAKLNVLRPSDASLVRFVDVWRVLRGTQIFSLYRIMTAAGLTFSDLDPAVLNCIRPDDWVNLGLSTRIANAMLREGVASTDMLLRLSESDLLSIPNLGVKLVAPIVALQTKLREENEGSSTNPETTAPEPAA